MCRRCEGEPYCGVTALFRGDVQRRTEHGEREDWLVVSSRVIIFLGTTALGPEFVPLFRGCETAISALSEDERAKIDALSVKTSRPAVGAP